MDLSQVVRSQAPKPYFASGSIATLGLSLARSTGLLELFTFSRETYIASGWPRKFVTSPLADSIVKERVTPQSMRNRNRRRGYPTPRSRDHRAVPSDLA